MSDISPGWRHLVRVLSWSIRQASDPRCRTQGLFRGPEGFPPMQKVVPCLWFDGQAEQAATYYVALLPDSRIDRVVRSPVETRSGPAGSVLVVEFTLAGSKYIGLNGGPQFHFTEAVSFQILCADQAEVDRLWAALSEGGSTNQ